MNLAKRIAQQSIPHSLLFVGDDIKEIVDRFAIDLITSGISHCHKIVSPIHPDIHHYYPEGKTGMHSISALRQLRGEVAMSPYEGKWKVFIIHDAERMLPTSANALLKTFEEPPDQTVIALLSSYPDKILPTVLSRCQTIYFPTPSQQTLIPLQYQLLDFLSQERPLDEIEEITGQLEEQKKQWEKEMSRSLPKDLTPLQKEAYNSEIQGAVTMKYQEKAILLLETIILWQRDRTLLELEGGMRYLTFPEKVAEIKQASYIPLDRIESIISKSRLAIERSIKLTTCLKTLLLQLR